MDHTAPAPQQDRRRASREAIERLVASRTEMLAQYAALAAQRPFQASAYLREALAEFCDALVDYTAEAHFRLYRFIEAASERRRAVREVAEQVYPRISDSTQCILEFNDLYGNPEGETDLERLERHLSRLGEILAERIELEDRIIAALTAPRPPSV